MKFPFFPVINVKQTAKATARVRGLYAGDSKDAIERYTINPLGDGIQAQGLPSLTNVVSQGNSCISTLSGSFADHEALSTAAHYGLYNTTASPTHLIIDSVCCSQQSVFSANERFTVFAQVNPLNPASFTANTSAVVTSMSGRHRYDGYAVTYGNGAMANATKWIPIGQSYGPTFGNHFTNTFSSIDIPLNGQWFVPPGSAFILALQITTINGPQLVTGSFRWHEMTGLPAR